MLFSHSEGAVQQFTLETSRFTTHELNWQPETDRQSFPCKLFIIQRTTHKPEPAAGKKKIRRKITWKWSFRTERKYRVFTCFPSVQQRANGETWRRENAASTEQRWQWGGPKVYFLVAGLFPITQTRNDTVLLLLLLPLLLSPVCCCFTLSFHPCSRCNRRTSTHFKCQRLSIKCSNVIDQMDF